MHQASDDATLRALLVELNDQGRAGIALKAESGEGEDIETLDQSASEPKAGEILLKACRIAPITPVYASNANHTEAAWARRQDRLREVYGGEICVDRSQDIGLLRGSKRPLNPVEAAHQGRGEPLKEFQEGGSSYDQDHRVPQTSLEVQRIGLFEARLFPKAAYSVDLCVPMPANRAPEFDPSVLDLRPTWLDPEQDWVLWMAAHESSGVFDRGHEWLLLQNKMVGGQNSHDGLRIALVGVEEGE
jgi:hypothetical protein